MKITVIPGDGIGPAITEAALKILAELCPDLSFEYAKAGLAAQESEGDLLPEQTLKLIEKNKICLKGPLTTPIGKGFKSINVTLRQKFDLYCNLRPVISFPGTLSRFDNIDLITVRENTEGLYCGEGQTLSEDGERAEALSIVTKKGSERIIRKAFNVARSRGRKKVTIVHKANILKTTSGLFLETGRRVAKDYPDIECDEVIVDAACMKLVMNPHQFDVLVATNLFGDILSDLCAGLVGGLGMAPGSNIGEDIAIFEAVHGSAPDIAGKNIANPSSLILASALMLEHLDRHAEAKKLREALRKTLEEEDSLTPDLGGTGTTSSLTEAIIKRL